MRKPSPRMTSEGPLDPAHFLQLAAVDFSGIYAVHLAAKDERLKMTRLAMSLLSVPFVAATALASTGVIHPANLTQWASVPPYLFALVAIFGVFGILPYLRLIEAVNAHGRTARALNNFRLLYVTHLKNELDWQPNLPVDPRFPETFAPLTWPGINVMMMAIVNSAYLTIGITGLSGAEPDALLLVISIGLVSLVHYLVYYVRCNVTRRRRLPHNILEI